MRIEFDPTNRDEATAVRAVLDAMYRTNTVPGNWTEITASDDPEELERVEEEVKGLLAVPDLDSNGEPHDPRIHSTPPTLKNDGTWRAKRGVKAEEIAAVRAEREELEANLTATDAELIEQAKPLEIAPAQEQSAPPAPSAPAQAPTPPAPPAPGPVAPAEETVQEHIAEVTALAQPSFLDVMKAITAAQKAGKVDTAKVKELCAAIGAGDSTMGLNGADNGDKRQVFLIVLNLDTEPRDAIIAEAMKEKEPSARLDLIKATVGTR